MGARNVPAGIPDLDQGQFLPMGDDDEFEIGVRDSDGALVIKSDSAGSDVVLDSSLNMTVPGNLTVDGTTTQVDDIVTDKIDVQDSGGTTQFLIDAESATPVLDYNGNKAQNVSALEADTGFSVTYDDDGGAETLTDMGVTSSPAGGVEQSIGIKVDGNFVFKAYAEADGSGGIQGRQLRALSAGVRVDNTEYFKGLDSNDNEVQLVGVTGSDVVLLGDVSGNGLNTQIEADGTVGIDVQTGGNVNFDNGDVRVNADGNKLEFGAGQDAALAYEATPDVLDLTGKDLRFSAITGTPTMGGHDHTSGGMTAVPNSGLSNSSVTVAGNSVDLGGSTTVSANDLSDFSTSTESAGDIPIWDNTASQYENAGISAGTDINISTGDASITIDHADTSDQSGNSNFGGGVVLDGLSLNGRGHVTGFSTKDHDSRYDNYSSWTLEEGDGESTSVGSGDRAVIDGGTDMTTELTSTSPPTVRVDHADTSSQGDVSTGGATVINDIDVNNRGHVTNMNTENRTIDDWQNSGDSSNNNVDADTVDGSDASDLGGAIGGGVFGPQGRDFQDFNHAPGNTNKSYLYGAIYITTSTTKNIILYMWNQGGGRAATVPQLKFYDGAGNTLISGSTNANVTFFSVSGNVSLAGNAGYYMYGKWEFALNPFNIAIAHT